MVTGDNGRVRHRRGASLSPGIQAACGHRIVHPCFTRYSMQKLRSLVSPQNEIYQASRKPTMRCRNSYSQYPLGLKSIAKVHNADSSIRVSVALLDSASRMTRRTAVERSGPQQARECLPARRLWAGEELGELGINPCPGRALLLKHKES
jgi:hypothetical protein